MTSNDINFKQQKSNTSICFKILLTIFVFRYWIRCCYRDPCSWDQLPCPCGKYCKAGAGAGGEGLVGRSLETCRCLHLDPLEVVVTHLRSRSSRSLSLSCFSGCWIHLEVLWREREEEEDELQWSDKPVKIRHLSLGVQVCWLIPTPPAPIGLEEATGPRNGHISREPWGTLI